MPGENLTKFDSPEDVLHTPAIVELHRREREFQAERPFKKFLRLKLFLKETDTPGNGFTALADKAKFITIQNDTKAQIKPCVEMISQLEAKFQTYASENEISVGIVINLLAHMKEQVWAENWEAFNVAAQKAQTAVRTLESIISNMVGSEAESEDAAKNLAQA